MENNSRKSGFELLRIIFIFMIIIAHAIAFSGNEKYCLLKEELSINNCFSICFSIWGQLGVYGFVALSSYFLTEKSRVKMSKILKIILETYIFCISFCIIGYIFKIPNFGFKEIIKEILPFGNYQYWFINVYLFFIILCPYIHKFCKGLKEHELKKLLIVLTVLIPIYNIFWENIGGKLSNFIYVFILMYFIKNYKLDFFEKNAKKMVIVLSTIHLSLCLLLFVLGNVLNIKKYFDILIMLRGPIQGANLIIILDAISLVFIFKKYKFSSKIINSIGKTTLGIYVIHDNFILCDTLFGYNKKSLLWENIFNVSSFLNTNIYPIYIIGISVITLLICSIIDKFTNLFLNKVLGSNKVSKICSKIDNWYNNTIIEEAI